LISIDRLHPAPAFAWVPSHVGVHGNEEADRLAKDGTTAAGVELQVPHEARAEYQLIDNHIMAMWQLEYSSGLTGAA